MKKSSEQEMKKKHFKLQSRSMNNVYGKEKLSHRKCVHVQRFISWWEK